MTSPAKQHLEKLHALLTQYNITIAGSYQSSDQSDVALHAWPCGASGQLKVYVEVLNHSTLDVVAATLTSHGFGVEPDRSHTDSVYLKISNAV